MKLKVLSWNIWYDNNFDQITKYLKSANADIIGLQEVSPDDKMRDTISFLKNLGYDYVFAPVFIVMKDGRTAGNAVFTKYKIQKNKEHTLSDIGNRKALEVAIEVGGKNLHIFCTHLTHTHQQPWPIQILQTENLIKVLPPNYTIVMGDFNATPESPTIQKIRNALADTDPKNQPTWSNYIEGCKVCNIQDISIRLDYIFTTKDIKTSSFKVESSKASDHLPISVILDI
jgi:endonuclease/exonuclease/phosphatase family metal-dependent hydrolase